MRRWTGVAGLAFVVLAFVSALVQGETPDAEDADALDQFARFWADSDNHGQALAETIAGFVGLFFFLWFLGGLAIQLRAAEAGASVATVVVAAGGAGFVALGAVDHAVTNIIGITLNFSDGYVVDPGLALILDQLGTGLFLAAMIMVGAATAAAGVVIRQTGVLPAWLAWVGFAIAALSLPAIPPVTFVAALLLAVFVAATSIVMLTRPAPAAS